MSQPVIQTSFNAGEWAPALNARVDLAKYHSGAAVLRNFFVDYRGGATTRPGTKYILQTYKQSAVRLIPFQASFTTSYELEFGDKYIRFFSNGSPVLEGVFTGSAGTNANPAVITIPGHNFIVGDWVWSTGSWNQIVFQYLIVASVAGNNVTFTDLSGNPINSTGFGAFTPGGGFQRLYTIASPYAASDLYLIKYSQNVTQLYLCHPNYAPQLLTLISATNWTIAAITFGSTVATPGGTAISTTLGAGSVNYAYVVTAVDSNGQESQPTAFINLLSHTDIRSVAATTTISWAAVAGAASYNIYRAEPSYTGAIQVGSAFGFVGNVTGLAFNDSNINPDFSQPPPVIQNPFSGAGVASIAITAAGVYTSVPSLTFSGGAPSTPAQANAILGAVSATVAAGGNGYSVGDIFVANVVTLQVTSTTGFGAITGVAIVNAGAILYGPTPANPVVSGGGHGAGATINLTWGVTQTQLTSSGAGYGGVPAIAFGSGGTGAVATATLGAPSAGNPSVPGFYQQRLILAGPNGSPAQFNMSQPGSFLNYNVTNPVQPDNAIQETLTDGQLNSIKSMVSSQAGLLVLTDKKAWLLNGGSSGAPLDATAIVANPQAYNGASDLQPLLSNYDILYVQAKGSIVRDITYDFYRNIFTGSDISILSSHLFYGYQLIQWCWAEEPHKMIWAVRNDGTMLTCTFVKDQEMIAWARHDTNGAYKSVITVTETTSFGNVDAVYCVAQRSINGVSVQYIERFVQLNYPQDYISSWQVDAGIGYNGAPASTFSGAQHLGGAVVTGVADGAEINFTMPVSGTFVFGGGGTPGLTGIASASVVTVGLAFTPQIQTLALDLGEPTVQGKRKKVSAVTVRCANALGLSTGRSFGTSLVPMQDLVLGNVGTMSNQVVSGLVTSDARTIVDPQYDVFGQFCIQQSHPYPASVLGVIPEIEVGDSK